MKHFLVVGNPIEHSLSPALHRQIFSQLGIEATYEKRAINPDDLPGLMDEIRSRALDGINVTLPFKETVLSWLDSLSPEAEAIGAVNCISREGDRITGHNTDYLACRHLIHEHDLVRPSRHFVVLGAGGSARSVVFALLKSGAPRISLINRNPDRAETLARHFAAVNPAAELHVATLDDIDGEQNIIWINCTPVGMAEWAGKSPVPADKIHSHHHVMDLIYRPLRTELIKQADNRNAGIVSGLDFFIEQGLASGRIWFGASALEGINRHQIIMDLILR